MWKEAFYPRISELMLTYHFPVSITSHKWKLTDSFAWMTSRKIKCVWVQGLTLNNMNLNIVTLYCSAQRQKSDGRIQNNALSFFFLFSISWVHSTYLPCFVLVIYFFRCLCVTWNYSYFLEKPIQWLNFLFKNFKSILLCSDTIE